MKTKKVIPLIIAMIVSSICYSQNMPRNNFVQHTLYEVIRLLLPASVVFSQVVSGTVLDAKSSQPLSGANVYEENSKKGTVTDAKGHFNINVSSDQKEVELKISYIGYKTIETSVKIKNENELIIYLSPEAFSIA